MPPEVIVYQARAFLFLFQGLSRVGGDDFQMLEIIVVIHQFSLFTRDLPQP